MMLGSGSVIRKERGGEYWCNGLISSDFMKEGMGRVSSWLGAMFIVKVINMGV